MKMRRLTLPVLVLSLALLSLVIPSVSMLARVQAAANTGQYSIASAKAPPQEDCGTVVFSDDFSGSLSNWDVHSGTWTIQNGELKGVRTDGGLDSWIYAGNLAWTNYLLSATVDFDTGNGDLVVRSTGHFQNEYRIQVWSSNAPQYANRYQIYRYKNGVRSSLTAGKPGAVDGTVPAPILITDPANVQVKVIDNTLFLYINGTLIDTVTDTDPLLSGRIGLGVIWDWQGYFDDVVVYSCAQVPTQQPDLTLSSSDITFSPSNPDPGQPVTINAAITNQGLAEASDIQVNFFDFDTQIGQATIQTLSVGASTEASIQASFPEASFRLITVKVDPGNTSPESDEANNEASQVLRVGQPDFSNAVMVVQASAASACQGDDVSITGRADYDFASVPA
jgi:hypothetical protein